MSVCGCTYYEGALSCEFNHSAVCGDFRFEIDTENCAAGSCVVDVNNRLIVLQVGIFEHLADRVVLHCLFGVAANSEDVG